MKTNGPQQLIRNSHRILLINFLVQGLVLVFLFVPIRVKGIHRLATLDETVKIADSIIHGKIVDASAAWVQDGRGKHIYTYATVDCIDYWKGSGGERIVVEWPGGTVGWITEEVSESQSLSGGEEVVLFLNQDLRPAVGIYSKCRVANGVVLGVERQADITSFQMSVRRAAGASPDVPALEVPDTFPTVIGSVTTPKGNSVAVTPIGPASGTGAVRSGQSDGPVILAGTTIYDNTTTSGSLYNPGSAYEIRDFGTSSGGTVVEFVIGYATKLADPGTVTVRFYTGTTTSSLGTFLKGLTISGLSGSTSPGTWQGFTSTITLDVANQFVLPNGAFGYSYQFASANTGVLLAKGGAGNPDSFWNNSTLTYFGEDAYASFYMKVNATVSGTPPAITLISPSSAPAGISSAVTITGSNFGASPELLT